MLKKESVTKRTAILSIIMVIMALFAARTFAELESFEQLWEEDRMGDKGGLGSPYSRRIYLTPNIPAGALNEE